MRRALLCVLSSAFGACDGAFDLVPVTLPVDAMLTEGLVAHYTFDSIEDGLLLDSVGGNNGTCGAGCPQPTPGVRGGALQFDGVNTLIDVVGAEALDTTSAFTVTAWVKLDPASGAACFANKLFSSDRNSWQFCTFGGNLFVYTTGVPDGTLGPVAISRGVWHHVAARYDGLSVSFYFDSVLVETEVAAVAFDRGALVLGADRDSGVPNVLLLGALDDVRIYSRTLTTDELVALAQP